MSGLELRRLGKTFPGLVHLNIDSGPDDRDDFADDEMPCCMASAMRGPRACTCWEPVYDLEQAEAVAKFGRDPDLPGVVHEGPTMKTRETCCHDCAYRNDSPERAEGYDEELRDVAGTVGDVFACHEGMRRVVSWRHPDGRELPAGDGDYAPPMIGGVAFKADGTSADLCAGWAAHRRGLLGGDE